MHVDSTLFTMVDFRIHSNNIKPADGRILISEPLMNDFFFGRSVVLLIEHIESSGTFGVVMNKPMKFNISRISNQFPDFDAPVFLGGPVAKEQIFFIHTLGVCIPDSVKIIDGLFWGGDVEALSMLVTSGIANSSNVRFFLGYSGWDSGQLQSELQRNSWIVGNSITPILMETRPENLWQTCVDRMGKEYESWRRFPQNAEDN